MWPPPFPGAPVAAGIPRLAFLIAGAVTGLLILRWSSAFNNKPKDSDPPQRRRRRRRRAVTYSSSFDDELSPTTEREYRAGSRRRGRRNAYGIEDETSEEEEDRTYYRRRGTPQGSDEGLGTDDEEDSGHRSARERQSSEGPSDESSPYAEESRNLLALLYSIAEDQARKEGYVHRSITCNHCGTSPVRGYRFRCANCIDYDLCEQCEAQDVHLKTHVFIKIRVPIPPLANPRSALLQVFYPGKDFTTASVDFDFTELQKRTHFDAVELEAFYDQYKSLSTTDSEEGGINRETFERCLGPLGLEKNLITDRIFAFFDANGDGVIDFEELACGLSILCKGNLDERIRHAFKGYDLNNDGLISRGELHEMFRAYFHLSMELVRDVVKTMEEGMMESFDDEASKPVSAAFAAPIPAGGSTDDEDESGSGEKRKGKGEGKLGADGDVFGPSFGGSRRAKEPTLSVSPPDNNSLFPHSSSSSQTTRPRRSSSASSHSPSSANLLPRPMRQRPNLPSTLRIEPLSEVPASLTTSPTALLAQSLPPPTPLTTTAPFPTSVPWSASGTPGPGLNSSNGEYHYPVMEAMSQDAIEEMVERTFEMAGIPEGRDTMTEEEFARVVEKDSNLLAWFEALGSVF